MTKHFQNPGRFMNFALLLLPLFVLYSCKVDFSPNAEWKETPAVWCVLDQDDDTTWVRVQRSYLSNDNLYNYTQVTDSINYPQGAIQVIIEKWAAEYGKDSVLSIKGEAPIDSKTLEYTENFNKDTGIFASGSQPLYCFPSKGWLVNGYVYKLVILKTSSLDTLAWATTSLIGQKYGDYPVDKRELTELLQPNINNPSYRMFHFYGNPKLSEIKWNTIARGRLYQPVIRFFYYHQDLDNNNEYYNDTTQRYFVDVKAPYTRRTSTTLEESSKIYETTFLASVKDQITQKDFSSKKGFCDTVDIFLTVCNEDLNAYMASTQPTSSIVQDRVIYTNINGGVGIFASRRTHFCFRIPTDPQTGPNTYHDKLKQLNVGF